MRGLFTLIAMVFLAGCSNDAPSASSVPAVPPLIETMMAKGFPADGQVYLQSKGRFVIKPETVVCYWPNGFGISDAILYESLNQSWSKPNGNSRTQPLKDGRCEIKSDTVFSYGKHSKNHQNKPYRLVLAVWQGDPAKGGAAWVGGIERVDEKYPVEGRMRHPSDSPEVYWSDLLARSQNFDVAQLSTEFVKSVKSGASK
jgi:hypothetical protein